MNPVIDYVFFESPEQAAQFRAELEPWLWLLPSWCQSVRVENLDLKGDSAMAVAPSPMYRRVRIEVYPHYFSATPEKRVEYLTHELFHILTGQVIHFVRERVIPEIERQNKPLGDFVEQQFIDVIEACTEEFGLAMARRAHR